MKHLSVNDVVKDRGCHEGWDEEFGCWIVDEDKVRFVVSFGGVWDLDVDLGVR